MRVNKLLSRLKYFYKINFTFRNDFDTENYAITQFNRVK